MPEITHTERGFTGTIIVAEHDKRRIHVIGRFGREGKELKPYEAFIVLGEEWTDGYEIDLEHALEEDHEYDYDDWVEEIECFIPGVLWGENQEYESVITDEHRALVVDI